MYAEESYVTNRADRRLPKHRTDVPRASYDVPERQTDVPERQTDVPGRQTVASCPFQVAFARSASCTVALPCSFSR